MIWVDKFDGNGFVWYNRGRGDPAANSGSYFHWDKITNAVYDGNHAGTCMYYPDLDGDGRADMHSITGTWTNQAETWFNRCPGLLDVQGDDQSGSPTDPGLPPFPGGGGPGEPPIPGSGTVIISPDIYNDPNPVVSCHPPCSFVLPPWTLPTPTVISMEPVTITYEENWRTTLTISGGIITTSAASYTSTVITVPPITTTEIPVWGVEWDDDDDDFVGIITLTSSVTFPPVTLTKPITTGEVTRDAITWTYSPGPYPTRQPGQNGDPDDENPPPPGPPPPPDDYPPTIEVHRGDPGPQCRDDQDCPSPCRGICNTIDGGCVGICGCIGLFCGGGSCVGPGCVGSGGGGGGGGDDPDDPCESSRISFCSVPCTLYDYPAPNADSTRCRRETCTSTIMVCGPTITGSTTTSTTTLECPEPTPFFNPDPDEQIAMVGDGGRGGIIVNPGDWTDDPNDTPADPTPTWTSDEPQPTPTSTSDDPPPSPTPSQEVWIAFEWTSASSGGDLPFPVVNAYWRWYEVASRDSGNYNFCNAQSVHEEFDNDGGLNDPGWPWTMTPSVQIWGRGNCYYTGVSNGAGWFGCDGVDEFRCAVDPRSEERIDCSDLLEIEVIYVPRVRCVIPGGV